MAQNKRALLVVDEAQNLSARAIEELRMLSNFQFADRALLQSFLVGQPELRRLLRAPQMEQLRQRVIASYHLGPMDAEETARYIQHRLHLVGWKNDPSFTPEAMASIYSVTGGVPRRINTLCNRLLLSLFLAEKHAADRSDVDADHERDLARTGPCRRADPPADNAGVAEMEDASTPAPHLSTATVAGIAARLDRIERSLSSLHDLLGGRSARATSRRRALALGERHRSALLHRVRRGAFCTCVERRPSVADARCALACTSRVFAVWLLPS